AFRGVVLGGGISLRQTAVMDDYGRGVSPAEFAALPRGEITENWSRVPLDELERGCLGHLDAEGFRYYIPALMLSVLNHYDKSSMRVIGTILGLYPKKDSWSYCMSRYSLLTPAQKSAIAGFLAALPELIELYGGDRQILPRALRNYWHEFLRSGHTM
ncbi:MAG: hypothetical protein JO010_12965, partial [Alphaproteobacteria bacterium]|nr:hypothetical protein [Alphaproteobacteria bacterium]